MDIPILYEDNHLLIVEKPINIPVQRDRSKDRDLLTILKEIIKIKYNKPGNVYLGLIHRLDRPVGGVMVFAKTSKAASRMSNLFRKQEITRSYLAVVRGNVKKEQGSLVHYLKKDRRKNQVFSVKSHEKDAKKSILSYQVLKRSKKYTLIQTKLKTGRPHQIRVQFSEIGHPIYGDQKYGARLSKRGEQIALWSHTLSFIHPVKQEEIVVISQPKSTYPWNVWKDL